MEEKFLLVLRVAEDQKVEFIMDLKEWQRT